MSNRFRPNMVHIYLHPEEAKFIKDYSDKNFMTVSELIRGWIHEVMKREGYELNEPTLPEPTKRGRKAKR